MEEEKSHSEKKNEFPLQTSAWNDNIENVLSDIQVSCQQYKRQCLDSARHEMSVYTGLMYTMLIVSPVSGILSTINIANDILAIQILVVIFTFLSSIFSAIIKFSKFDQKSTRHQTYASKYASLESNIKRQLSLLREDRVPSGKYLDWVSSSYEELLAATPLLPPVQGDKPLVTPKAVKDISDPDLNRYNDSKMKYELGRLDLMAVKVNN
jgi:hypothetical protein